MEPTHGVDISWLHHSKDPHGARESITPVKEKEDPFAKAGEKVAEPPSRGRRWSKSAGSDTNGAQESKQNGDTPTKSPGNKLHLSLKQNEEPPKSPTVASPSAKDTKPRPQESKRRGSWISNISSKFSSSSGQPNPTAPPAPPTVSTPELKEVTASVSNGTSSSSALMSPPPKDPKKPETPPATSPPAKSGGSSFLQSALRRLSSSGGSGGGKVQGNGGICPRKVMNVDPYRERCQIEDLQPAKLRRVSFSVDVEIAPAVQYEEPEEESPPPPPPAARRPSLTQLEKAAAAKKAKEKNAKMKDMAEGEALKNPEAIAEKKEATGNVEKVEAKIEPSPNPAADEVKKEEPNGELKKKKKPRTEAEKAERKERKRQAALANGTIPLELAWNNSSSEDVSIPGTPIVRANDRPTIDPLRIYRRCCQLRETPVLKRVADQLSAPNATDSNQPGVVMAIDLTGFKIPLTDTITLSDWLAIVPVRKLMLEDCDLTDEAVRVVLAGLLSAKTPDQAKHNRHLVKGHVANGARTERIGVIEKISLKDNPRVTREGWAHISYFINMSKSLKAMDISGIKLPTNAPVISPIKQQHHHFHRSPAETKIPINVAEVFEKSLAERMAKNQFEELVMGRCELDTEMIEGIIRGATACGVKRLGLAYNGLDVQGVEAVCNFLLTGRCEGLDLGGNDLVEHIPRLVTALEGQEHPLYALSVADCGLTPHSLKTLLPTLANLVNFRFVDLSHNHQLFSSQPNAVALLRKYLPLMQNLRRIHLNDVAMESEQCIALAEILPEVPYLAHLGISENPKLTALASASNKDEALLEEACAFFASIMVAVRVSKSIVSVDMEMPTQESSELVKALGKQVLAYALRNMERGPAAEAIGNATGERHDSLVEVPDVLLHLVGQIDEYKDDKHEGDVPAPSEDYIVSGTGVVKALGICLGNKALDRRPSRGIGEGERDSGTSTPLQVASEDVDQFKAKDMSKNLLESARKIRNRLQAALAKESQSHNEHTYRRLQFLDSTLTRMIERFEEEYPEVRNKQADAASIGEQSIESDPLSTSQNFTNPFAKGSSAETAEILAGEDDEEETKPRSLSRRGSDASLAARHQAHEEGQMHRFGQRIRRSLLAPPHFDYHHQSTEAEEDEHLKLLRAKLEATPGEVIKDQVAKYGIDQVIKELGCSAKELARLKEHDPESFAKLREAQINTETNRDGATTLESLASVASGDDEGAGESAAKKDE